MKTQINTLVNGSQFQVGTNSAERSNIAKQVVAENPESMAIAIRGLVIVLTAKYSTSRKSVNYSAPIPVELYREFAGDHGLPAKNPLAFINISGDMRVDMQTNSKKAFYVTIDNSEITIL